MRLWGKVNVLRFCEAFPSRKTKLLFVSQGHTQKPRQRGEGGGSLGEGRQVCVSEGESFVTFGLGIKKAASLYDLGWDFHSFGVASVGVTAPGILLDLGNKYKQGIHTLSKR